MKNYLFPILRFSYSFILFVSVLACSEYVDLMEEEVVETTTEPKVIQVQTKQPEVGASVLFKADLKSLGEHNRLEYGFMWYQPDVEVIEVREIKVGIAYETQEFNETVTGLPKSDIIVCSFARVESSGETIIGEEIRFSHDL